MRRILLLALAGLVVAGLPRLLGRASSVERRRRSTTRLGLSLDQEESEQSPPPRASVSQMLGMLAFPVLLLGVVGGWMLVSGLREHPAAPVWSIPGGDAERGRAALVAYGCGACHVIPGIPTATGRVGPQLHDLRNQIYLAGRLPNTPANLMAWIREPQHLDPANAMPNLGVTEPQARDMAAYLYGAE